MSNKSIFKSLSNEDVLSALSSGSNRVKLTKSHYHKTIVGALMHYVECGDISLAPEIFENIKRNFSASVAKQFAVYSVTYVPSLELIRDTNDNIAGVKHRKGAKRFFTIPNSGEWAETNHESVTFFDFKVTDRKAVDGVKKIQSLIKSLVKAYTENDENDDNFHNVTITQIQALAQMAHDLGMNTGDMNLPEEITIDDGTILNIAPYVQAQEIDKSLAAIKDFSEIKTHMAMN